MTSDALTKGEKQRNFVTPNIVWANQTTESFVYHWLCALAMFDVMRFPAFVGALDVISSLLLIC